MSHDSETPRHLRALVPLLPLVLLLPVILVSQTEPRPARRPNLILIVTDDQRWDSLSAVPSVRRLLGGHGVTFTNAFVTTPLCCPSRASILTGLYSRHTGVLSNWPPDGGAPAFHDASTLATWLHGAGYRTAAIGKYLNDYPLIGRTYVPPGWDDWHVFASAEAKFYTGYTLNENRTLVQYGYERADYSTTVLTERAVQFIRATRRPFFLYFTPFAPHDPSVPLGGAPAVVPAPPLGGAVNEPDMSDKPVGARPPRLSRAGVEQIRTMKTRMWASLRPIDLAVRELIEQLQELRLLDNTVVAFISDNGYLLGEHRLLGKGSAYEESIRVPLVVRVPWIRSGRTDPHLALNIDLAPTFAELAGVRPPSPVDGRSLVPLLGDHRFTGAWRSAFIVEYLGQLRFEISHRFQGIRTTRYLYVHDVGEGVELYDLQTDPFEERNLAGQPQVATVQMRLETEFLALLSSIHE